MPQLHKFTFLDQTLSVLIILGTMYILNVYVYLPKLITILKFRVRFQNLLKKKNFQNVVLLRSITLKANQSLVFALNTLTTVNKCLIEAHREYINIGRYISLKYFSNFRVRD